MKSLSRQNYEKLSDDELVYVKEQTIQNMNDIKTQIEHAKAVKKTCGEKADEHWLFKANAALRYQSQAHQLLTVIISDRKKKNIAKIDAENEVRFISVAKRMLSDEMFKAILSESKLRPLT